MPAMTTGIMRPRLLPLLAVLLVGAAPLAAGAAPATTDSPCAAPEARQFDFWIGEWDLVSRSRNRNDPADATWYETGTARLKVYPVVDGCALVEHLEGALSSGPVRVFSVRAFDPQLGKWVVIVDWPWGDDPVPAFLRLTGELRDGRAEFPFRADGAAEGPPDHRYTYERLDADSLPLGERRLRRRRRHLEPRVADGGHPARSRP